MRSPKSLFIIFILPSLVILSAIIVFPFLYNLYLSFQRWDIRFKGATPEFIGITNYLQAFSDARFFNSLNKTFYMLSLAVPVEFLFGFLLALFFYEPFKGRRLLSFFILFPLALSDAVVGLVWGLVLVPTYGPVDYFMRTLGLWELLGFKRPISLVTTYPMEMIIVADIWQWTPFFFIILLAGLASLPKEIIESAEIDGAAKFNMVRYIMMPLLKQISGVALIIRIVDIFKTFGLPYVMTKGGPGFASEVASLYIFNQALLFLNITYAASLTIILILIVTVVINVFIRGYGLRF